MSKADPCVFKVPEVQKRDVEESLDCLKREVQLLDESLADLISRLIRITCPINEPSPAEQDYEAKTPLGADVCDVVNRVVDMRRTVRSYVYNLGV